MGVRFKIKDFINRDLLQEFHLREICQLSAADKLSPWLTTAWEELAEHEIAEVMGISQGRVSQVTSQRSYVPSEKREKWRRTKR